MTKFLKLPFSFDESKLLKDLIAINDEKWIPHFNTFGYEGNWKVISLIADQGDDSNIFALTNSPVKLEETETLKACPYFKAVIETFKCPVITARILRLEVGAEIKPHKDHELGYENNNFRLHIPITTNKDVRFILDGVQIKMLPGECWYTNVNFTHSVINKGTTDRVHLVIDLERNEWSDNLFYSLAPEDSFRPAPNDHYSPETIRQIIDELKHRNEPASMQLIIDLEEKLKSLDE